MLGGESALLMLRRKSVFYSCRTNITLTSLLKIENALDDIGNLIVTCN